LKGLVGHFGVEEAGNGRDEFFRGGVPPEGVEIIVKHRGPVKRLQI